LREAEVDRKPSDRELAHKLIREGIAMKVTYNVLFLTILAYSPRFARKLRSKAALLDT
jgi:hypothetical protein